MPLFNPESNALVSLFSSCCGTEKSSNLPPSATSGRQRSVFLLVFSIGISFAFQYGVAPALQPDKNAPQFLQNFWTKGCDNDNPNDALSRNLVEKCSGYAGVYRSAGSTLLFFLLAAIAATFKPTANREAWPAKFILYLFLVTASVFIPNQPLFDPILMNIFRVGASFFIIFQQLIILDLAYNLNENWVEKSNIAERDEGEGMGRKWLMALLVGSALFLLVSFTAIGLMYGYFLGCNTNVAFISITLIMDILCTVVQLTGEVSSLFTSASIFMYGTFLCYTAVSKNPDASCNPVLGEEDVLGTILGITVVILSLAWTGWSVTAHKPVRADTDIVEEGQFRPESRSGSDIQSQEDENNDKNRHVTGVVVGANTLDRQNDYGCFHKVEEQDGAGNGNNPTSKTAFSNSWKLNIILCLVTCWYAMGLTGWGLIDIGGNSANPGVGRVSMWMIISSQWLVFAFYLWSLVAPSLFPDRDFS
eukprot:CAMPEP_0184865756 /NCGR_PEP_ID=MMETSP0580-20130426/18930_1 /TAXON_ID=1118495 /ORGANISM="Dactyliosolen fragilissimus" /LENGTH=475 /DNA_ID=CAMNT_0027365067 /DNA_START=75 /DNA_END=1503 /DNA_ORIENTATION=-